MGWVQDSIEEFRKLPPAGKIALGAAGVGVAVLGYLQYRNSQNSQANAAQSAANSAAANGLALSNATGIPGVFASNAPQPPATASSGAPANNFVPHVANGVIDIFAPGFWTTQEPHTVSENGGPTVTSAPTRTRSWYEQQYPWVQRSTSAITTSGGGVLFPQSAN